MKDMETYSENTYSSLLYLMLETVGVKDVAHDHIASHLGKTVGLLTFLKGIPFAVKSRKLYLPVDIMAKVCLYLLDDPLYLFHSSSH